MTTFQPSASLLAFSRSLKEIRHFSQGQYNLMCLSQELIHPQSTTAISQAESAPLFLVIQLEAGEEEKLPILGYGEGCCGTFKLTAGSLAFHPEAYLNDELSNQLVHYLLQQIDLVGYEQLGQLESIILTLFSYLKKRHKQYLEIKRGQHFSISPYRLNKIQAFILEHIKQDISVEQLAEIANLSLFHFIRMFKQTTGITPHKFVNYMKLQKAKELLLMTNAPIIEICNETGFRCPSHFSRAFKKSFGKTPLRYRKEFLLSQYS